MHPAPVETLEQSTKLGCRNAHHTVLYTRPLEAAGLQPLGHQAQACFILPDQLDPVRALCTEDIDHPGIGIAAILSADERGQRVRTFAKIHWPRCHHHPRARTETDQGAALNASITAAIRASWGQGFAYPRRMATTLDWVDGLFDCMSRIKYVRQQAAEPMVLMCCLGNCRSISATARFRAGEIVCGERDCFRS